MWRQGILYARNYNDNKSVTRGGPTFHLEGLALAENDPDPTEDFNVRLELCRAPVQIGPNIARFTEVSATIEAWSEQVWIALGGQC